MRGFFMPKRAKRICRHAGCGALCDADYCEKHSNEAVRAGVMYRGNSAKRGYGYKWRKAREDYLSHNPLCIRCEVDDKTTAATVVDHIIPHKGDWSKFWNRKNWQPLCKPCHDKKTASEDGGFGNNG